MQSFHTGACIKRDDVTAGAQVRARWPGHVVRRAFSDVISGLQPSWPDVDAERTLDADRRRLEYSTSARNACELYTRRLTDAIASKVRPCRALLQVLAPDLQNILRFIVRLS